MRKELFPIILSLAFCFFSCANSQVRNSENKIITMLKEFYTAYNNIWSIKPPLANDILNSRLDSLTTKYCTFELRERARKSLEDDYGQDLLTKGFPGIDLFENLKIEKNSSNPNDYLVSYTTISYDIGGNPNKINVILHVIVIKDTDKYRISEVK